MLPAVTTERQVTRQILVYTWLTVNGFEFSVGFLVDSLTAIEMSIELEGRYKIDISDEELAEVARRQVEA